MPWQERIWKGTIWRIVEQMFCCQSCSLGEDGVRWSVCGGAHGFSKRTDLFLLLPFASGLHFLKAMKTEIIYILGIIMINSNLFSQQLLNCIEKENLGKKLAWDVLWSSSYRWQYSGLENFQTSFNDDFTFQWQNQCYFTTKRNLTFMRCYFSCLLKQE